ncbi:hypothetical protein BRADI_4g16275v3 [Brachypodium distachyon]|uniref:Uncharacterized protein n=1 Tax=Brachypodium distachyon TaxID=15368 RepID=A0A2K2CN67_BRADI|nr:hypothetical protein BRADI_4g16275v3 [Brachypodium distachyon]
MESPPSPVNPFRPGTDEGFGNDHSNSDEAFGGDGLGDQNFGGRRLLKEKEEGKGFGSEPTKRTIPADISGRRLNLCPAVSSAECPNISDLIRSLATPSRTSSIDQTTNLAGFRANSSMPRGCGGVVGFRGGGFLRDPRGRSSVGGPAGAGGSDPAEDLTGSGGHLLVRMMSTAGGGGTFRVGGRRWQLAVQRIGGGGPAEGFVYVGLRRVEDPGACWPASVLEGAGMPDYGRIAEPLCERLSESRACVEELVRRGEGGKSAHLIAGGLGVTTTMSLYMMS